METCRTCEDKQRWMNEFSPKVTQVCELKKGGIVMKIDEWVVREVIDTLQQANITLLGITGLDSPQEIAKKCEENETAINRRIMNAIGLLKSEERRNSYDRRIHQQD